MTSPSCGDQRWKSQETSTDRPFTDYSQAFETRNGLYQFTRLPFGVTNGVACFQRGMMKLVQEQNLKKAMYPYLDNITICGKDQEDHDKNLTYFLDAAKRKNITYNDNKSIVLNQAPPNPWIRHRRSDHSSGSWTATTIAWASCSKQHKVPQ